MYIVCLLLAVVLVSGSTAAEGQKGESSSVQKEESVPPTRDASQPPLAGGEVQPPVGGWSGISETVPFEVSRVRGCVLEILRERGESVPGPEGQKDVIKTGFRSVTGEELKRIAQLPMQGKARWTKGRYSIQLSASAGPGDSTVLALSVRIIGHGETELPLLRPSPWWSLRSSGVLEQEVLSAILQCCKK